MLYTLFNNVLTSFKKGLYAIVWDLYWVRDATTGKELVVVDHVELIVMT